MNIKRFSWSPIPPIYNIQSCYIRFIPQASKCLNVSSDMQEKVNAQSMWHECGEESDDEFNRIKEKSYNAVENSD